MTKRRAPGGYNQKLTLPSSLPARRVAHAYRPHRRRRSRRSPPRRQELRFGLEQVTAQLKNVTNKLDPVLRPDSIFDPTDPNTSGRVVALTLVAQTKHPLAKIPEFCGAGVYAIYYRGDSGPYAPLKGWTTRSTSARPIRTNRPPRTRSARAPSCRPG